MDELLGGKGFPEGSVIFIVGGPGTGKTTFGLQYLAAEPRSASLASTSVLMRI